jgi:hypothetical protein
LPALIGAEVWIMLKMTAAGPFSTMFRPSVLTMPSVMLCASPRGLPTASMNCPTRTSFELTSGIARRPAALILSTARSSAESVPAMVARRVAPVDKVTV